jgi:hypothetical protein
MGFSKKVDRLLNASKRAFGEKVTFYPKAGGAIEVTGIFSADFQIVDPETDQIISTNQPGLGVNLNDFETDPKQNDEVEIRGTKYRVTDKREDGQGGATLLLNKVKASDRVEHPRVR